MFNISDIDRPLNVFKYQFVAKYQQRTFFIINFINYLSAFRIHEIYEKEITNLKEIFFKNGFPIKFVNDLINRSNNLNKNCTKKN